MTYAFLGALLSGGLAVAFLLWRKSVVEKARDTLALKLDFATEAIKEYSALLASNDKEHDESISRLESQIQTLRTQRDHAIEANTTPGAIGGMLQGLHSNDLEDPNA